MSSIDWDETVRRVNNVLRRDSASGWPVVQNEEVAWYGPFVSSLALAVGGSEIVYGDGQLIANEDGSFIADAVFFTAKAVVVARVTGERISAREVAREVRLYSRRELQFVGVNAAGDAFSQDMFRNWPGRVELEVRYAPDVVIELPLRPRLSTPEQRQELLVLLDALRGEIGD
ncbi:hypothetical protein G3T36_17985 [Diaminobutyricibacter tongyongensis]|uniref:Uncharacterized protein n=1 Tax=Leifsonia tongyongensis TaxID=1268043 RepID=A0A6L9Y256_9MICO|nr:hypothetical protein [Diaminobutyricibacter tongyongensis]NEN07750.1 hypothetical protein [Diaminobutyricibacter tongyongensis]